MKSKPPSPPSKPSTPSQWLGSSRDDHLQRKQPWVAISFAALASILLTACSSPSSSELEVTVPNENIHTVAEQASQTYHTLTLQTPTPSWKLVPMLLYRRSDGTYLCVHTLSAPDGMVAQMLSSTQNQISFPHEGEEEPSIKHFVLGKTWNWNGNPEVTFIDDLEEIDPFIADAKSVAFSVN